MTDGGESPKTAAGSRKKLPAALDQNWRGKTLYLKSKYGGWVWGFKAFEDNLHKRVVDKFEEDVTVLKPVVEFERNYLRDGAGDGDFPIGNGFFQFNGKAYLVGGETTGGLSDGIEIDDVPYSQIWMVIKSSDKLYEFDHVTGTLNPLHHLALPHPMPGPIVAHIDDKIYVLYGNNVRCEMLRSPMNSEKCFQVLDLDDNGKLGWRSLPPPPFYKGDLSHGVLKHFKGVVGHKLYAGIGRDHVYAFDPETRQWRKDYFMFNQGAKQLSSRLMMDGMGLHKEEKDYCFVVVSAGLSGDYPREIGCFASLVYGKTGRLLHHQRIPEAMPPHGLPLSSYQVIDVEDDEQDGDAGQLSSTFCFVYTTYNSLIGISVLRISLAVASPDETTTSSFRWRDGRLALKVESLKCLLYEKPNSVEDLYDGPFDAVFLRQLQG